MSASSAFRPCSPTSRRRRRRISPRARLIRAFAQEEAQVKAFEQSNQEYIRRGLRLVQLMGMLWPTLEFILGLAMVIVLLVGGRQVLAHRITVGNFTAFSTYLVMLTWPIIALGWVVNLFERGTASVTRIHELLAEQPSIDDRDAAPSLPGHANSAATSNSATSIQLWNADGTRLPKCSTISL